MSLLKQENDMIKVTYTTYSDLLKKEFTDSKEVKSMEDFNLYNLALFHGRAVIIKTEEI
jgi:hypothetical protein